MVTINGKELPPFFKAIEGLLFLQYEKENEQPILSKNAARLLTRNVSRSYKELRYIEEPLLRPEECFIEDLQGYSRKPTEPNQLYRQNQNPLIVFGRLHAYYYTEKNFDAAKKQIIGVTSEIRTIVYAWALNREDLDLAKFILNTTLETTLEQNTVKVFADAYLEFLMRNNIEHRYNTEHIAIASHEDHKENEELQLTASKSEDEPFLQFGPEKNLPHNIGLLTIFEHMDAFSPTMRNDVEAYLSSKENYNHGLDLYLEIGHLIERNDYNSVCAILDSPQLTNWLFSPLFSPHSLLPEDPNWSPFASFYLDAIESSRGNDLSMFKMFESLNPYNISIENLLESDLIPAADSSKKVIISKKLLESGLKTAVDSGNEAIIEYLIHKIFKIKDLIESNEPIKPNLTLDNELKNIINYTFSHVFSNIMCLITMSKDSIINDNDYKKICNNIHMIKFMLKKIESISKDKNYLISVSDMINPDFNNRFLDIIGIFKWSEEHGNRVLTAYKTNLDANSKQLLFLFLTDPFICSRLTSETIVTAADSTDEFVRNAALNTQIDFKEND